MNPASLTVTAQQSARKGMVKRSRLTGRSSRRWVAERGDGGQRDVDEFGGGEHGGPGWSALCDHGLSGHRWHVHAEGLYD